VLLELIRAGLYNRASRVNEYNEVVHAPPFTRIDHVQLAMPLGEEERARSFFVGILGMNEIAKPEELAQRGGCWFASGDVQIHLGVENNFRAARKAHPALQCSDYTSLLQNLRAKGIEVIEAADIPGVQRAHIFDPFGNRIELIAD
jgi:catechol 2,3-dioxygenase-like lactoylglutathione lyase family enzyme